MKYRTIVIDPPWDIKFIKLKNRPNQKKISYNIMTDEEIKQFPIHEYSDENCVLFMWTTMTKLPNSLEIVKFWGFKYHALLTWDKTNGKTLFGITRNAEFVIVCYQGKLILNDRGKSIWAVFRESLTKHSVKPRIFYDMLLHTTYEPRIDIFSRKKHMGFHSYGDQAEEPITLERFN